MDECQDALPATGVGQAKPVDDCARGKNTRHAVQLVRIAPGSAVLDCELAAVGRAGRLIFDTDPALGRPRSLTTHLLLLMAGHERGAWVAATFLAVLLVLLCFLL